MPVTLHYSLPLEERAQLGTDKCWQDWKDMASHNKSHRAPPDVSYHVYIDDEMACRRSAFCVDNSWKVREWMSCEQFVAMLARQL